MYLECLMRYYAIRLPHMLFLPLVLRWFLLQGPRGPSGSLGPTGKPGRRVSKNVNDRNIAGMIVWEGMIISTDTLGYDGP